MAKVFSVTMKRSKETKGTFVYTCDDEDAAVPTLYVKKHAFDDKAPKVIKLTISTGDK